MAVFLVRKKSLVIVEAGEFSVGTSVGLDFGRDQAVMPVVFRVRPRILAAASAVKPRLVELVDFDFMVKYLGVVVNIQRYMASSSRHREIVIRFPLFNRSMAQRIELSHGETLKGWSVDVMEVQHF